MKSLLLVLYSIYYVAVLIAKINGICTEPGTKSIFCCTWWSRDKHGDCLRYTRHHLFVVPPHFKILNHTLLSLAEGASCCFPSLGFQAFLPFDLKELLLAGGSAMLPLYNDLEIANGLTLLQHELQLVKHILFQYNNYHCFELLVFFFCSMITLTYSFKLLVCYI